MKARIWDRTRDPMGNFVGLGSSVCTKKDIVCHGTYSMLWTGSLNDATFICDNAVGCTIYIVIML